MDARTKFDPPLPEGFYGNAISFPCAKTMAGELANKSLSFTVKLINEAKSAVNDEYMRLNTGSMSGEFLAKETEMLDEAKGIGLPNFLSRPVFKNLLQRLVDQISERSLELVFKDLFLKKKSECEKHVRETIEMEKLVDFTLCPSYTGEYGRLLFVSIYIYFFKLF